MFLGRTFFDLDRFYVSTQFGCYVSSTRLFGILLTYKASPARATGGFVIQTRTRPEALWAQGRLLGALV